MSKLADYDVEKCISKGVNHSEVYRASHLESGTTVAIKRIKIFDMHPEIRKEVETEISLLQQLDHPNLIQYHEHFTHDGDLYIVMELAAGGQMAQKVEAVRNSRERVQETFLWRWLYDVASALAYLHGRRVLHRDVKPSHIFLGENGQAKLGDFGLSKVMSAKTQIAFSCVGTPFYMSPELVRGQGYAFGSDVWSLGCSIYELATGYPPFFRADSDFYALGDAICNARYPTLSAEHWSREFINALGEILTVDASKRPSAQRILDLAACKLVGRIQDFEIKGTIGRGKFSEVHRSLWKVGGDREVALKRVQIFEMETEARKECITEVNLLKEMKHNTIVRYLDSFVENSELVIVLELAPHGDLANLCRLLKESDRRLTDTQLWATIFQVSDALHYMHRKRIMHRDIKPANVFLCSHGVVKLGDLGLGRYFSSNTYRAHSIVGTPFYMSPEVITSSGGHGGYSFKSDIWSLGCVLYELTALQSPFASSRLNFYILGMQIRSGEYPPLAESTSKAIQNLCADMIQVNPDSRPSAHAVFVATDEQFAMCAPTTAEESNRAEATSEAGRIRTQLVRAAGVVRSTLEALGLAAPSSAGGVSMWSGIASSAGSSAYPSASQATATSASQVSVAGSGIAVGRSSSFPQPHAPEAQKSARSSTADRPDRPERMIAAMIGEAVQMAVPPSGPPPARSSAAAKRPDRVPQPHGAPPPQPPVREDGSAALGAQSHIVSRHRRHAPAAPGGSLSARGSSRDRERLDALTYAGPLSARRALTPERGRQQPASQVSHLRFAGGAMSEGRKPPPAVQVGFPPIQRTPREHSREAFADRASERGGVDLPPRTEREMHADRTGRSDPTQQRDYGSLTGRTAHSQPGSAGSGISSADLPMLEAMAMPSRRGVGASSLASLGAEEISPSKERATGMRLPGATTSMRAH